MSGYHCAAKRSKRFGRRLTATGLGVLLTVGGFALLPTAQAAPVTIVSLTFNDAQTSQYLYARPLLNSHGMDGTFYAASGWVDAGSNGSVDAAQLRQLYRDGHEIGGMGRDHKSLTDPSTDLAYKTAQVCDDFDRLSQLGVDPQTFAYPQAAVNAAAKSIVQGCGFRAGRNIGQLSTTTTPFAETVPPVDAYSVRTAFFPTGPVTLATLQASVNAAASHGGGWMPMVFNQVCHQGSANYNTCMASAKPVDDAVLGQFLDWLATSGQAGGAPSDVIVKTVRDVMGAPTPPPIPTDPTTVSLTFNDGLISQYDTRSILAEHNMHGTFYVSSGIVDAHAAGYMPSWLLDDLYRDGNEIAGGTRDHKDLTQTYFADPAQDLAYKTAQVCDDRNRLAQLGYDPRSFAYPAGAFNDTAKQIVAGCGYASARAIGKLAPVGAPAYAETIPPRDAMAVRTLDLQPGAVTLSWLQQSVLAAADNGGGWLPIGFNQVCSQADANYATCMSAPRPIDAGVFDAFLDWLQTSAPATVDVRTVRDVMGAPQQPPLEPRDTTVSLTFDDGLSSQFRARSLFTAHGVQGTYYINSGPVLAGESGTMTWTQIHALESDGNEIGGHTIDHVDLTTASTSAAYKRDQVCKDRATLLAQGFNPVSFAYPFATFNAAAEAIVQACGYSSGRTGGTLSPAGPHYSEDIPPPNAYAIRILGTTFDGPITLQSLQDAVNAAASHGGGWVPMLFHTICFEADANFNSCMGGYRTVSDTTLSAFLTWLDGQTPNGISTSTIGEVMGSSTLPAVAITSPAYDDVVETSLPALSGTAAAAGGDVTVAIYSGAAASGTPLQTLNAGNTSGQWSTTPTSPLADGTYTIQARQSQAGQQGVSAPIIVSVNGDKVVPEVSITGPTADATVTTLSPSISGTAGTAAGDETTVEVKIYAGAAASGSLVQTLTANVTAAGAWSVDASLPSDGTYTAVASQGDSSGNSGSSAPVTFNVDTTAPSVSITTPADQQAVHSPSVGVTGTASAAGDVTLRLYSGTAASGTPLSTQPAPVTANAWTATVTGLAAGTYTLQASQQDAVGNTGLSSPVTIVVSSAMTVTSVTPNQVGQGVVGRQLTISGSGFSAATTVSINGSGVTMSAPVLVNPSTMTVTVDVAAAASAGPRTVSVDRAGEIGASCIGCLTVNASPTATSLSPNSLGQGATNATVRLNGLRITAGAAISFSGTGVSATIATVGTSFVNLSVSVAGTASIGTRDVTVTNPDGGKAVCVGCFSVVAGPKITAVSPTSIAQNTTSVVTITGTGFTGSLTVSLSGGQLALSKQTVVNATTLRVTVKVNKNATTGLRDLTVVSNTNSGRDTLLGAVRIT
jgi:peptidoglycan/xylan/chitin deacetylase (PgdA/CDA1 family)